MNQELIDMAKEVGIQEGEFERYKGEEGKRKAYMMLPEELEAFAALVAASESERITKMLNYLDMKAQPYHNYYKHAAVEINRKDGEGEKI